MKTETFEYRCAACGGTFQGTREADERAHREAQRLWGKDGTAADMDIICDDCFKEMRGAGFVPTEPKAS